MELDQETIAIVIFGCALIGLNELNHNLHKAFDELVEQLDDDHFIKKNIGSPHPIFGTYDCIEETLKKLTLSGVIEFGGSNFEKIFIKIDKNSALSLINDSAIKISVEDLTKLAQKFAFCVKFLSPQITYNLQKENVT